jgi:GTP-binding protein
MLATTLEADAFLGRLLTGRIRSGSVKAGQWVRALSRTGETVENFRVSKVLAFRGLERQAIELGEAGDIVALSGMTEATVADTLADSSVEQPIPAQPIDPPTLSMTFRINDGPLAGQEGDKVQSRVIRERLLREAEGNVALRITEGEDKDAFEVAGRGELQLGILIETMRREGFELTIGKPRVVIRDGEGGEKLEPIEEAVIDVNDEHTGAVIEKLSSRRGELVEMRPSGAGRTRLRFLIPTRGLIGYQPELLSDTRGTAVLLSNAQGEAVAYALWNLQERGPMMIEPGMRVYRGMIVGEHTRGNDLEVNVLKGKQLTNIRAAGKDENVLLTPPMKLSLERALSYVEEDELVEVTPQSIRLRKTVLDPNDRKRLERAKASAA